MLYCATLRVLDILSVGMASLLSTSMTSDEFLNVYFKICIKHFEVLTAYNME